jgi:hypothetical protein
VEDLHMGTTQGRNEEICSPKYFRNSSFFIC